MFQETLSALGGWRCKRFDVVEPLASRRSARAEQLSVFGEMLSALAEALSAFAERRCKRFDVVEPFASRRSARVE